MFDPLTVAHEIKSPIKRKSKIFPKWYRSTIITIWHKDPCVDGTDDSCGWFMRSRHGSKEILEKIIKNFASEWDTVFENDGRKYSTGWFHPEGQPNMSTIGIVLNMFQVASFYTMGRKKANKFMKKNLYL